MVDKKTISRREMLKKIGVAAGATLVTPSLWTRLGVASPAHSVSTAKKTLVGLIAYSGRYPSLAMFDHDRECGTGALVPWAGHLWVITYPPHAPLGGDTKLYAIDHNLHRVTKPQSVGGTCANRMIHRESRQLFIGPYVIDSKGGIRVISFKEMPGRLTGTARDLTDPANKIYYATMEEGFYKVNVHTLDVETLNKDGNFDGRSSIDGALLPGHHGKGLYSAQGRLVYSNNGKTGENKKISPATRDLQKTAGCLAAWNGKEWRVVARHQFTEVTGPGGIRGNQSESDPLWSVGWDWRSVIVKVLDKNEWTTYRLPIADDTYMALHGWYTEWPRIRQVGPQGQYLMNMHGMWFRFPGKFRPKDISGIKPLGSYLKITGDFARWDGRVVFGCDDASTLQNPLVGQSQSNLWFTKWEQLGRDYGRPAGWGGPWMHDDVEADILSEPFLIKGFEQRVLHLTHGSDRAVIFSIEIWDGKRARRWRTVTVPARGYEYVILPASLREEWIRLRLNHPAKDVTAYFILGPGGGRNTDRSMFKTLLDAGTAGTGEHSVGLIRPMGHDTGKLEFAAWSISKDGAVKRVGYYQIDEDMKLHRVDKHGAFERLAKKAKIKRKDVLIDQASVVVTEEGKRFRLPKGLAIYDSPTEFGWSRAEREVVTERSLLNVAGTMYWLPRRSAGGVAGIKPISTHDKLIADFCSWRGMLVLAGGDAGVASSDGHEVKSDDGKVALWFGDIDDLWKCGKPRGVGGPWQKAAVKAGQASDPYLMTGYDKKTLKLSAETGEPVVFTVEVDFLGDGTWMTYRKLPIEPGKIRIHQFPRGYSARWVRLRADHDCRATAMFIYE